MQIAPEVQEVEALAASANVRMSTVLKRAGVAQSTYWRWRNDGSEPGTGTIRKLKSALAQLSDAK